MYSGFSSYASPHIFAVLFSAGYTVGLTAMCSIVAVIAVAIAVMPSLVSACYGETGLERWYPFREYVQVAESIYCPLGPGFYNRGVLQNLHDIFGTSWLLRLVAPSTGGVYNMRHATTPLPGQIGVVALKQRLADVAAAKHS